MLCRWDWGVHNKRLRGGRDQPDATLDPTPLFLQLNLLSQQCSRAHPCSTIPTTDLSLKVEELQVQAEMECLPSPLNPHLTATISTVSARWSAATSLPLNPTVPAGTGHSTDLLPGKLTASTAAFSLGYRSPKGTVVIILIELARGTHLLFSRYAFSHAVPFYHFPLGSGCLSSHCPDKAGRTGFSLRIRALVEHPGTGSKRLGQPRQSCNRIPLKWLRLSRAPGSRYMNTEPTALQLLQGSLHKSLGFVLGSCKEQQAKAPALFLRWPASKSLTFEPRISNCSFCSEHHSMHTEHTEMCSVTLA